MGSEDIYGNISRQYESMADAAKENHEAVEADAFPRFLAEHGGELDIPR